MTIALQTTRNVLPLLLRPIVKFCLRHSIRFGEVSELLKSAFVAVAVEELERKGHEISASRISVVTGVHRKDTTSFLKHGVGRRESKNIVASILGLWQNSRKFLNQVGRPRVLTAEGKDSEFSALVQAVSVDLNPYTVLFELERIGAIQRTRKGVKLVSRLYVPKGDIEAGLRLLSADAEDLYAAVDENLRTDGVAPNLHIKTEYDDIPLKFKERIRSWFFKEGSAFHQRARNFISQFDRETNPILESGKDRMRVAVGSFSIIEQLERDI